MDGPFEFINTVRAMGGYSLIELIVDLQRGNITRRTAISRMYNIVLDRSPSKGELDHYIRRLEEVGDPVIVFTEFVMGARGELQAEMEKYRK